jgi:predicted DNA-binding mobile mystery protein A
MSEDPANHGSKGIPRLSPALGDVIRPASGWIRAIRAAQKLTLADVARRLKVTPPAIRAFEQAEREDRITLGSLRRTAAAMDCDLIYALVPRSVPKATEAKSDSSSDSTDRTASESNVSGKVTDLTWHAQRGEL